MTLAALKLGLECRKAARIRQGAAGRCPYLPLTEWILERDKLTNEILKGKGKAPYIRKDRCRHDSI